MSKKSETKYTEKYVTPYMHESIDIRDFGDAMLAYSGAGIVYYSKRAAEKEFYWWHMAYTVIAFAVSIGSFLLLPVVFAIILTFVAFVTADTLKIVGERSIEKKIEENLKEEYLVLAKERVSKNTQNTAL